MGKLIDGKLIAQKIEAKTAQRVANLKKKKITPTLAVFLVGADKPSQTYVRKKGEAAKRLGINFILKELKEKISTKALVKQIKLAQKIKNLSGLIVQLPLPDNIDTGLVLNAINPQFDVDCLTDANIGKMVMGTNTIAPPTPGAALAVLKDLGIDLIGKNVTIIGMGPLVGKPLAILLMNERASVTTCNSKTRDVKSKCLKADIIVTGVGKKDILRGDMVSPGAIVIDTGVNFVDGKMYGDVNVTEVLKKAKFVTPTPGGIGPITVAMLLWNTVMGAEQNIYS
ncbi:MAG: bifunctional 5,10-methylenetetrahydrofolate dehydrogenase/5,10-methenyltetrahydrofolate cyclohydrolase [Candidatus Magasanikbacteria bacterium]